ncbi:hypothetical protein ABW19_dt0202072 [Dactylella cylindrospora]|nr:hypothetical protein ABW19_dt0202072 [Dactylella cylindrospora]
MTVEQGINPNEPIGLSEEQTREYLEFLQFTPEEMEQIREPSLENLEVLMVRHLASAPFGNIDIHYSPDHKIIIELEHLFDKIVKRKRGGYCMELNGLFSHLLATLGYNNWLGGARVTREWTGSIANRNFSGKSHCVNLIQFDDGTVYMADVGFGGSNIVRPVLLAEGTIINGIGVEKHQLTKASLPETRRKTKHWLLQHKPEEQSPWIDLYVFFEDEVTFRDFEIMSNWTSTKEEIFMRNIVLARVIREGNKPVGRYTMFNKGIKKRLNFETNELPELQSEEERVKALKEYWEIDLSDEDRVAIKGREPEILADEVKVSA